MGEKQMQAFVKELQLVNRAHLFKLKFCQDEYDYFENKLHMLIEKHFPLKCKKVFSNDKPWVTNSREFKRLS